jgi:hypothetical protein
MPKTKRQIRFDLIFVMVDFVGEESTHLQKWGQAALQYNN